MGEKTNTNGKPQGKLTYEQLNQMAGDLYQQNQQLISRINQLQEAVDATEFNRLSFFISMLFKVMDHQDAYKTEFVVWCVESIEMALTGFAETFYGEKKGAEPEDNKNKENEAE